MKHPFVGALFIASMIVAAMATIAQSQAQSEPPGKAQAQSITIDDLRGITISAAITYVGRVRSLKNNLEYSGETDQRFHVEIGPGASVKWTVTGEQRTGGRVASRTQSYSAIIGRPDLRPDQAGTRAVVWTLEGNTLTLLRVFDVGGRVMKFTLTRSGSSLSCTIRGSNAREVGAGHTKAKSAFGDQVEILSMRQTSSDCRVSKG